LKEVYILATERTEPVSLDLVREGFEGDEVEVVPMDGGRGFTVKSGEVAIEVRFEARAEPIPVDEELLSGSDEAVEALSKARGYYRIAFEPGKPQASVPVFEALWCARNLQGHAEGVLLDLTASKVHDAADVAEITELDFDIRDHVNLHAVEAIEGDTPLWVHTHGMEKFGARDVEIFHLSEEDLNAAEAFINELCTDLAFGQGPEAHSAVETSAGDTFILQPSEEARVNLLGVPLDTFEGHEGLYLTVVSTQGRHNLSELLKPYHDRFRQEAPERSAYLRDRAQKLLPMFKARDQRKGLMEPLTFLARAPFEVHPEGDGESIAEHLWLEVVGWEEGKLLGKLIDGAAHTTEWRKGAQVEVEEEMVDAIALGREGRPLDEEEMMTLLNAERPM